MTFEPENILNQNSKHTHSVPDLWNPPGASGRGESSLPWHCDARMTLVSWRVCPLAAEPLEARKKGRIIR